MTLNVLEGQFTAVLSELCML